MPRPDHPQAQVGCERLGTKLLICAMCALWVVGGCSKAREQDVEVVFADVATLLEERCVECHGGASPSAGYRLDSYLSAIACVPGGQPAVRPADAEAPLLEVLDRADHAGLLSAGERDLLRRWVEGGALSSVDGVHPPGIIDPRSADWHGRLLATEGFRPMLDASLEGACGRCHAGTPSGAAAMTHPVPGAVACTTCHSSPAGVLDCATCHGQGERPYPPRDRCFFPDSPDGGAHAAHVLPSKIAPRGVGCASCHPALPPDIISGKHANGVVDVVFAPIVGGVSSSYQRETATCVVECHDRGGTRPIVEWHESVSLDCNSCHRTPPLNHYRAACSSCHIGIDAEGTALTPDAPHINGRWDFRP